MSHLDIMVHIQSTLKTINTNTLRPIFHRFLSPRQRTLSVNELYKLGIPAFMAAALDKIILIPTIPVTTYIHRIVPLEPIVPKIVGIPYGLLCVARENVSGGDVVTKEDFLEPRPGDLILFHDNKEENDSKYYIRPVQPVEYMQDAYMDVIWFMKSIHKNEF